MLDEKAARAAIYPHLYTLSYIQMQGHLSVGQLYSDFRDFNNGVCQVMKITIAESNPGMGLLNTKTFCFSPDPAVGSCGCRN